MPKIGSAFLEASEEEFAGLVNSSTFGCCACGVPHGQDHGSLFLCSSCGAREGFRHAANCHFHRALDCSDASIIGIDLAKPGGDETSLVYRRMQRDCEEARVAGLGDPCPHCGYVSGRHRLDCGFWVDRMDGRVPLSSPARQVQERNGPVTHAAGSFPAKAMVR